MVVPDDIRVLDCVISGDQRVTEDPLRYTSTMKVTNPTGVGAGWSVGWRLALGRIVL